MREKHGGAERILVEMDDVLFEDEGERMRPEDAIAIIRRNERGRQGLIRGRAVRRAGELDASQGLYDGAGAGNGGGVGLGFGLPTTGGYRPSAGGAADMSSTSGTGGDVGVGMDTQAAAELMQRVTRGYLSRMAAKRKR